MDKAPRTTVISLIFNVLCGTYHIVFGGMARSWWLLSVGVYYCVLSVTRFVLLRTKRNELALARFAGRMLLLLSAPLCGTVILSVFADTGHKFHISVMLGIATYSFTKITLATVKWIRSRHSRSPKKIALRNVSFATGFVSVFSLQRSMLVTFEGMSAEEISLMNALTGTGVCMIVFLLGLNLVSKKKILFHTLNK